MAKVRGDEVIKLENSDELDHEKLVIDMGGVKNQKEKEKEKDKDKDKVILKAPVRPGRIDPIFFRFLKIKSIFNIILVKNNDSEANEAPNINSQFLQI